MPRYVIRFKIPGFDSTGEEHRWVGKAEDDDQANLRVRQFAGKIFGGAGALDPEQVEILSLYKSGKNEEIDMSPVAVGQNVRLKESYLPSGEVGTSYRDGVVVEVLGNNSYGLHLDGYTNDFGPITVDMNRKHFDPV
jgi:hypothetical protein